MAININRILDKVDDGRLKRAYGYYKQNRVKNGFINNHILIAEVIGNDIYRVKIDLKSVSGECTCPDNASFCKHILAVLLAYKNDKQFFIDFDNLSLELLKKSKEELINIIKQMSLDKIDLVTLLTINRKPITELKDFSKDIYGIGAFFDDFIDYNEVPNLLRKLEAMRNLAINSKEGGDFKTSFAISWSLVRTISKKIGECDDSNGQIGDFFFRCISDLSEIINIVLINPKEREMFFFEALSLWEKEDFGIEDGFLDIIHYSAIKEDIGFLNNKIDSILSKRKSNYFEEYKKLDLKELKEKLKNHENGTTNTNKAKTKD